MRDFFREYYDGLMKKGQYDVAFRFLARHPEIIDDDNPHVQIMGVYMGLKPHVSREELESGLTRVLRDVTGDSRATIDFPSM